MDKVRIAIVGCGNISQLNVPGYLQHPNCEVVALCDSTPGRAEARAKQWGISPRIYTDYEQVLNDPNVDAVELLTPQQHHATMTVDGLDADKHISCQKPMCTSVAEADVMVAAARRAKTKFRMTENYIYYPPILKAKELLDAGAIGEPSLVRFHTVIGGQAEGSMVDTDPEAFVWRNDPRLNPLGIVYEDGVHKFATAMKWVGDIEKIFGIVGKTQEHFMEMPSALIWKFEGMDCLGMCDYVYAPHMTVRTKYFAGDDYMEIHGSKGSIHVTRCIAELLDFAPVLLIKGTETEGIEVPSDFIEGFNGAASDFIDSIIEDRQPDLDAEFAKKTIQVAMATYEAARTEGPAYPRAMV